LQGFSNTTYPQLSASLISKLLPVIHHEEVSCLDDDPQKRATTEFTLLVHRQFSSVLRPLRAYLVLSRITAGRKADHEPLRLRAASAFFSDLERLSTSLILLIVISSNIYQLDTIYAHAGRSPRFL
jgi:hypothetical protein